MAEKQNIEIRDESQEEKRGKERKRERNNQKSYRIIALPSGGSCGRRVRVVHIQIRIAARRSGHVEIYPVSTIPQAMCLVVFSKRAQMTVNASILTTKKHNGNGIGK